MLSLCIVNISQSFNEKWLSSDLKSTFQPHVCTNNKIPDNGHDDPTMEQKLNFADEAVCVK